MVARSLATCRRAQTNVCDAWRFRLSKTLNSPVDNLPTVKVQSVCQVFLLSCVRVYFPLFAITRQSYLSVSSNGCRPGGVSKGWNDSSIPTREKTHACNKKILLNLNTHAHALLDTFRHTHKQTFTHTCTMSWRGVMCVRVCARVFVWCVRVCACVCVGGLGVYRQGWCESVRTMDSSHEDHPVWSPLFCLRDSNIFVCQEHFIKQLIS